MSLAEFRAAEKNVESEAAENGLKVHVTSVFVSEQAISGCFLRVLKSSTEPRCLKFIRFYYYLAAVLSSRGGSRKWYEVLGEVGVVKPADVVVSR
jgi:hypothetical protein